MDKRKYTVIQIGRRNSYLVAKSVLASGRLDKLITDYYPSRLEFFLAKTLSKSIFSFGFCDKILKRELSDFKNDEIQSVFNLISFSIARFLPYHLFVKLFFFRVDRIASSETILLCLSEAPVLFRRRLGQLRILESVLSAKRDYELYSSFDNIEPNLLRMRQELLIIEQESIEYSDFVFTPSLYLQELIKNYYNKNASIIPYFSRHESDSFKAKDFKSEYKKFLFVGRISQIKGIDILIEVFNRRPNLTCTLVGPVEDNFLINDLPSNLHYLGFKDGCELMNIFNNSDFFIFPTRNEGSALVLYEAFSYGLPVVTTPYAGSVVENNYNGLIIEPVYSNFLDAVDVFSSFTMEEYLRYSLASIELSDKYTKNEYCKNVKDYLDNF